MTNPTYAERAKSELSELRSLLERAETELTDVLTLQAALDDETRLNDEFQTLLQSDESEDVVAEKLKEVMAARRMREQHGTFQEAVSHRKASQDQLEQTFAAMRSFTNNFVVPTGFKLPPIPKELRGKLIPAAQENAMSVSLRVRRRDRADDNDADRQFLLQLIRNGWDLVWVIDELRAFAPKQVAAKLKDDWRNSDKRPKAGPVQEMIALKKTLQSVGLVECKEAPKPGALSDFLKEVVSRDSRLREMYNLDRA